MVSLSSHLKDNELSVLGYRAAKIINDSFILYVDNQSAGKPFNSIPHLTYNCY